MENYTLTITKITPNPEFNEEEYKRRNWYAQEIFPPRNIETVLHINLTDEQYQKVKKEVLTVF